MFAGSGRLLEPLPATMKGRVYASTLAAADVVILRALMRSEQTLSFRYDFLNQPDAELPDDLRARLRPRSEWVFILNPPFMGNSPLRGERPRAELNTAVRAAMLPLRLGRASLNLTTQGLFRLAELIRDYDLDATVGVFSQASIWVGDGYLDFRKWVWEPQLGFQSGFLFDAREFKGVTGEWPAAFTVWRRGSAPRPLVLDVMEQGEIIGRKELLQPDRPLSKWVPRPKNEIAAPQMTSAVRVANGKRARRDKAASNALAYVSWLGNDVRNSKGTCLLSAPGAQAGWSITPENWQQSLVAAAARMLVKPNWLNDADQFTAPNTSHFLYQQFLTDAVVWLIGSMGNHTASLEGVTYGGETHELINQLFWLTPEEMLRIADLPEQVRAACESAEPRYLSLWLRTRVLKADAAHILAEMKRLVAVTAAARPLADPKLQLDRRWDASWYQIRRGLLWPSDHYTPPPNVLRRFRSFKRHHKRLGERLAAQLYDLGFLPHPMLPYGDPRPLLNPSARGC